MFDPLITPGTLVTSIEGLDKLVPANPLFILEDNGHVAFADSLAFNAAKLTPKLPTPPHGELVRDAKGQFTGEIHEPPAISLFAAVIPGIAPAQYVSNIRKLLEHAASVGCTSVHDCGIGLIDPQLDLNSIAAAM